MRMMRRDDVKSALLRERRAWLERNGDAEDVEILSVTQLVQLLDDGASRPNELEGRNVQYHDISPKAVRQRLRSLKRPRIEERDDAGPSAVSFFSKHVWVTGFLRHERVDSKRPNGTMCLCDAANRIPVHIVFPAFELLNGLVLVKTWTVVQQHDLDHKVWCRWMEVHGDPVLLHISDDSQRLQMEDLMRIIRDHYPTSDPPMFTGRKTWESLQVDMDAEPLNAVTVTREANKKRKVYVVLGKIVSISPISVQDDSASSHFFLEIENEEPVNGAISSVNILLAGANAMQWYPFLWPGLLIFLTDLKKVYYAECELFLLQTTQTEGSAPGSSRIFVWNTLNEAFSPPITSHKPIVDKIHNVVSGATVELEGTVTSIVWDECLMLESEVPVVVALFHYPWSEIKGCIRVGSRVRLYQAHVLHHPSHHLGRLRVGLCSRSHIRILSHAPASNEMLACYKVDDRRRLQKKWSVFGDFGRQSLALSLWWLDLLEVLVQQFGFLKGIDHHSESRGPEFRCVRRREATLAIGQDVFSVSIGQHRSTLTLAQRFLSPHGANDKCCPSIHQGCSSEDCPSAKVLTLRDLEVVIQNLAQAKITEAAAQHESVVWPIQIEPHQLSYLCAIGVLRGCDGASDLEVIDQTAVIPVILDVNENASLGVEAGCAVYALKRFGAIVERCSGAAANEESYSEYLGVSLLVETNDIQRISLCSSMHDGRRSAAESEDVRSNVLVFVTHIGPWKRRRKMRGSGSDVRSIRGFGFQALDCYGSQVKWGSLHCTDLLVDTRCESWFVQKHSWYMFRNAQVNSSSLTETGHAKFASIWSKMLDICAVGSLGANFERATASGCDAAKDAGLYVTTSYIVNCSGTVRPIRLLPTRLLLGEDDFSAPMQEDVHRCLTSLGELAVKSSSTTAVRDLFVTELSVEESDSTPVSKADPHTARLLDLVGIVTERHLYSKSTTSNHKCHGQQLATSEDTPSRTRMCRLKLRDLSSLEAVFITVDTDAFGAMSALQPGAVVEVSMVQCFIARASYKPFLTWTHCTTARRVIDTKERSLTEGQIVSRMETTYLDTLYNTSVNDRTIKRFVAHLAHLSYAVLKRRCSQCKQALTLVKRHQSWIHTAAMAEDTSHHKCSWRQIAQNSPLFQQKTFLSCSLRGVIDDGSAQAELFIENDVVWELLRCSRGQRQRFEDLLVRQTSELSYFATRSTADSLFTSPTAQENQYYQNEWRAFVQETTATLGAFIVFAQRFYKAGSANTAPPTAVLSFGKDIQITTPSVPLLPLEAVRIDELNAQSELRRRLARRPSGAATSHFSAE